jgi:phosphatidylglycerophosphate synthase
MTARPKRWIILVPNALSVLRLTLAATFPAIAPGWRLVAVIVAGVSDLLDGLIARKFNATSVLGGLLDAIADKAMVLSVLLTLAAVGEIGWWQLLLVLSRDLSVGAVAAYTSMQRQWSRFRDMLPSLPGKITTAAVFGWFVALLWPALERLESPLFMIAATASVVAGVDYLMRFVRAWRAWIR